MLTGQRPESAGETRVASTQTLRLPSEQLATLPPGTADRIAHGQGLRLGDMRRALRNELDWVVARAMRHDRAERYASAGALADDLQRFLDRSEEHTSELQSLMRNSYAVFCLKKKKQKIIQYIQNTHHK